MNDIIIPVKPKPIFDANNVEIQPPTDNPFYFNASLLIATPGEADLVAKTVVVSYRLTDGRDFDRNKYIVRNWADTGQVYLPLDLLSQAVKNDGSLYVPVLNAIFEGFNLVVNTDSDLATYSF